jgi:hypothetical protein
LRQISVTVEHRNEVTETNQKSINHSIKEDICRKRLEKRCHKSAKSHTIDTNKAECLKANILLKDNPLIRRRLHREDDSEDLGNHVSRI